MKICFFTYIILELNSALDSGEYDDLPMHEAIAHIEAGDVVAWLKRRVPQLDLSLLSDHHIAEYQAALEDLLVNHAGRERLTWGVEKRALCLLLAWTNEIVQRASRWQPPEDANWGDIPLASLMPQ
ncbi:MAG: hypothetical protein K2X03_14730 [Bryobacteraceae bacterium]|nr:hypothetical protein [Bryobacteraceae bacterium]